MFAQVNLIARNEIREQYELNLEKIVGFVQRVHRWHDPKWGGIGFIAVNPEDDEDVRPAKVVNRRESIIRKLRSMNPEWNLYMAPNGFNRSADQNTFAKTTSEDVKWINAVFVEFDCVRRASLTPDEAKERLEAFLCDRNLPLPNYYVKTAHSLHSIWLVHPQKVRYIDYNDAGRYVDCGHKRAWKEFVKSLHVLLEPLRIGLDTQLTDISRKMRLPFTYHAASGTWTTLEWRHDATPNFYDLADAFGFNDIRQKYVQSQEKLGSKRDRSVQKAPARRKRAKRETNSWRCKVLEAKTEYLAIVARKLQDVHGRTTGYRSIMMCYCVSWWMQMGYTRSEAIERFLEWQMGVFREPLTAKYVWSKAPVKAYNPRKQTVIMQLAGDDETLQQEISEWIYGEKLRRKNERRYRVGERRPQEVHDGRQALETVELDDKIREMLGTMKQNEIADRLGVSPATITVAKKRLRLDDVVIDALRSGMSESDIRANARIRKMAQGLGSRAVEMSILRAQIRLMRARAAQSPDQGMGSNLSAGSENYCGCRRGYGGPPVGAVNIDPPLKFLQNTG